MHLLRCDVHNCSKDPQENPLIGYMKRLKRLRDIYPRYTFLTDRNVLD